LNFSVKPKSYCTAHNFKKLLVYFNGMLVSSNYKKKLYFNFFLKTIKTKKHNFDFTFLGFVQYCPAVMIETHITMHVLHMFFL